MGALKHRIQTLERDIDPSTREPEEFVRCWQGVCRSSAEVGGRCVHRAHWPGHRLHRQPLVLGAAEGMNIAALWHGRRFVVAADRVRTFNWGAWGALFESCALAGDATVAAATIAAAALYGIKAPAAALSAAVAHEGSFAHEGARQSAVGS